MIEIFDLSTLNQTIRQALVLDETVFTLIQSLPNGIWIALAIVCLASLSEALGQSIVLLINRVLPWRFGLALFLSTASNIIGYLIWTVSIWLIVTYGFGYPVPLVGVASAVGLAYAPQLFAFFTLIPFVGNGFGLLLALWSMLAAVFAVSVGLNMEIWEAIATNGLGWLLIQVWRRTLGRPAYALGRWIQNRVAGVPIEFTMRDIPKLRNRSAFLANWEAWIQKQRKGAHLQAPTIHAHMQPRVQINHSKSEN